MAVLLDFTPRGHRELRQSIQRSEGLGSRLPNDWGRVWEGQEQVIARFLSALIIFCCRTKEKYEAWHMTCLLFGHSLALVGGAPAAWMHVRMCSIDCQQNREALEGRLAFAPSLSYLSCHTEVGRVIESVSKAGIRDCCK